jgi:hypothetical protein
MLLRDDQKAFLSIPAFGNGWLERIGDRSSSSQAQVRFRAIVCCARPNARSSLRFELEEAWTQLRGRDTSMERILS